MTERVFNFNPGPATLPEEVLKEAQEELLNYKGTGMSIMENSHRSTQVESLIAETETLLLELLGLSDEYQVLFLQGGASTQFAHLPLNFITTDKKGYYVITGSFAKKAYEDAKIAKGNMVEVIASGKENNFRSIVDSEKIKPPQESAYLHITSNNTIYGTQWNDFPDFGGVPLVADMSSDILSRSLKDTNFALIYAGAQKNLGPAGVTIVIVRKDFLEKASEDLPSMLSYKTIASKNSLYNTPPVFAIYIVSLVVKWVKSQGLDAIELQNNQKADLIYKVIDSSSNFYTGHAAKEYRSLMNITYKLPNEELEKLFVQQANDQGLIGLKGHRSVGGIRASIYNAMPVEGCRKLTDFMKEFQAQNS